MTEWRERIDVRTVVLVVVLDLATYMLVFWLVLPKSEPVLAAMDPTMALAVGHVAQVVRLAIVGLLAARSFRRRRGMLVRSDALPSVLVGAAIMVAAGLVLGVVGHEVRDLAQPALLAWLAGIGEGLVFPVFGLLFVAPGPAEKPVLVSPTGRQSVRR